jgi:hypothetical protein
MASRERAAAMTSTMPTTTTSTSMSTSSTNSSLPLRNSNSTASSKLRSAAPYRDPKPVDGASDSQMNCLSPPTTISPSVTTHAVTLAVDVITGTINRAAVPAVASEVAATRKLRRSPRSPQSSIQTSPQKGDSGTSLRPPYRHDLRYIFDPFNSRMPFADSISGSGSEGDSEVSAAVHLYEPDSEAGSLPPPVRLRRLSLPCRVFRAIFKACSACVRPPSDPRSYGLSRSQPPAGSDSGG